MVLIGVNGPMKDQGVTTWVNWSGGNNLRVCASIVTINPVQTLAHLRLAFLTRD